MAKNKGGMFSFLMGMAAGAGALFLSQEKNRKKAERVARRVSAKAKKAKLAYDKDPLAFKKQARVELKRVAKKVIKKLPTKQTAKKKV